ncbi:hypothetical protein BJV77DRAFT_1023811 [Russula vinacea]|nr:hypothetical protein BJV77DRAFT_1023811 [Russula vinacea]
MDLEELEILLRKQTHTEEEYAKIIALIDLRVPPGSADFEPPLSALIYAAQGILHPTLSFNHIPDLLDILSQVERAREFSREHANWALIWQRFYETRPNPNVRVLQKSDKDPERLDATRRIFICIIEHVIRMHILYLWTHAEESQRLFHASLIPEEKARLAETGMSCFRFMHDAKLWEEQRIRELDVSMCSLKLKFIGNIEITDIAESITLYLKKVRGMEQRLQRLLAHHVP